MVSGVFFAGYRSRQCLIGAAVGLCGLLATCQRPPELSVVPKISFNKFQYLEGGVNVDTIRLTINFEDGNGDLGLKQTDTTAPFNEFLSGQIPNPNYYNILVDYFEQNLNTGKFDSLLSPLTYRGRFKPIYLDGQLGQPLTGTISYDIQVNNFPDDRDILFKIAIKDRALHSSNRVETVPFRIPRQ